MDQSGNTIKSISGALFSESQLPLGKLDLKPGIYNVKVSSGNNNFNSFVLKVNDGKNTKAPKNKSSETEDEIEEEIVYIDLDNLQKSELESEIENNTTLYESLDTATTLNNKQDQYTENTDYSIGKSVDNQYSTSNISSDNDFSKNQNDKTLINNESIQEATNSDNLISPNEFLPDAELNQNFDQLSYEQLPSIVDSNNDLNYNQVENQEQIKTIVDKLNSEIELSKNQYSDETQISLSNSNLIDNNLDILENVQNAKPNKLINDINSSENNLATSSFQENDQLIEVNSNNQITYNTQGAKSDNEIISNIDYQTLPEYLDSSKNDFSDAMSDSLPDRILLQNFSKIENTQANKADQTNQTNQTNQGNQINQPNQINQVLVNQVQANQANRNLLNEKVTNLETNENSLNYENTNEIQFLNLPLNNNQIDGELQNAQNEINEQTENTIAYVKVGSNATDAINFSEEIKQNNVGEFGTDSIRFGTEISNLNSNEQNNIKNPYSLNTSRFSPDYQKIFSNPQKQISLDAKTDKNAFSTQRINFDSFNNKTKGQNLESNSVGQENLNDNNFSLTQKLPENQSDFQLNQFKNANFIVNNDNFFEDTEDEDIDNNKKRKIKRIKYVTIGGDIIGTFEAVSDLKTADNQLLENIAIFEPNDLDIESQIYQEFANKRAEIQNIFEQESANKAVLRQAEQKIQNQLVDMILNNPSELIEDNAEGPMNQIINDVIQTQKEILSTITERIITEKSEKAIEPSNDLQKNDYKLNDLNSVKPEAEKYYIDASKVIQMIEDKEKENLQFKEIDEILLRQKIERELRYEFNQMQLDHEKKMRAVYRRMIESMYREFLNS